MKLIRLQILLLVPFYLFSQGMYIEDSKNGIAFSGSVVTNLNSKILVKTTSIGVSFGSRIDIGCSKAFVEETLSDYKKKTKANAFTLALYPIKGQTIASSKFGISFQYIDFLGDQSKLLSCGLLGASKEKISNNLSAIPVLGIFVNAGTKKLDKPFYSAVLSIALKYKVSKRVLFLIEPGGNISTISSSYGLSSGFIIII